MSSDLIQFDIPAVYWIARTSYKCKACGHRFDVLSPEGNEVVKFVEVDGRDEKWMPTYGRHGYLDLFERFVPEFGKSQQITVKLAREFEEAFASLQEPSPSGKPYSTFFQSRCPKCESVEMEIESEEVLTSPKLPWLGLRLP